MKTKELFNILKSNKDKSLIFEYMPDAFVGANYHITEVKHITVDSVDCGSNTDSWFETIIQLWENPIEIDKRDFMTVLKALEIFNKVGKMKPYNSEAEVKFEYSNATFHVAQLFVKDFEIRDNNLIIKLGSEKTKCKATDVCCATEEEILDPKEEPCCTPDGNCC